MKTIKPIFVDNVEMKYCPHCKLFLPFDKFSKQITSKTGYRSWCKKCINLERDSEKNKTVCKNYYEIKGREGTRQHKESNIQKYLYQSAKARAKTRNEEFTINLEDIIVPELCPIFNIPMRYNRGVKQDNSYSLDRIDSKKGYIKGNVWVISLRANRIKNDGTVEELRVIADKVEEKLNQIKEANLN